MNAADDTDGRFGRTRQIRLAERIDRGIRDEGDQRRPANAGEETRGRKEGAPRSERVRDAGRRVPGEADCARDARLLTEVAGVGRELQHR